MRLCRICGKNKAEQHRTTCRTCRRKANSTPVPPAPDANPESTYDSQYERYRAWMGMFKKVERSCLVDRREKRTIHGVISDLHIPFHDESAIRSGLHWLLKQKVNHLHIGGDFFDCYSMSRFSQYKSVPIREEFIAGRKILQYCSERFAEVTVCEGNHEARERKYLSSRLPPDLLSWYLDKSLMRRSIEDLQNVSIATNVVAGISMMWLSQVGQDCVIGHPDTASKIPLRPVDNFRHWLDEWHESIGMNRPRLVIMGHTHAAGIARVGPRMIVESGCLALQQSYALDSRLYPKPQNLAVTTFTQNEGITDLNSVRQYYP